jgi:hypothetical protein
MESDLRTLLTDEIGKRLGDHRPQFREGDEVATFACPSGALGDVIVQVDAGRGAVVYIFFPPHWPRAGPTHGHFDGYEPDATEAEIATDVVNFLTALFNDEYVVYCSKLSDGWIQASYRNKLVSFLFGPRRSSHAATWSGPWKHAAK